jgi:serine/threonine protein phosphatase PrpC
MVKEGEGDSTPGRWRAVGETVIGATHLRAEIPNQDALYLPPGPGLPMIVAVSDGHGSPKCFRSHLGSRFAIGTAALTLGEFLEGKEEPPAEDRAREHLPNVIARRWAEAVNLDLTLLPLTAEELAGLEERSGTDARRLVETNPLLAYGATILAAAVTDGAIVLVQLGDGEIVVVSDAKEVTRPLPDDERLFANETTSLSSPSAAQDFQVRVLTGPDAAPALVLLTTDGYANSFRDDEGFLKVGVDIFDLIAESGLDRISADIEPWLEEATRLGSGDDVTLAVACRTDAFRPQTPPEGTGEKTSDDTPPGEGTTAPATPSAEASAADGPERWILQWIW